MKVIGLILFRRLAMPVISFVVNVLWWIIHFYKLPGAIREKKRIKGRLGSMVEVGRLMSRFVWTKDIGDWTGWAITLIAKDMKDDCDTATTLGVWALKQINIPAKRVGLYNFKTRAGHSICVTKENNLMISNNDVVNISKHQWKHEISNHFNQKYNILLDGWKTYSI